MWNFSHNYISHIFPYLLFFSELSYQKYDPIEKSYSSHDFLLDYFKKHLSECFSEMGSSLFVWMHGCYKVSEQTLRSSIENFIKSIGCIYFEEITKSKNTYEIIDLFEKIPFFTEPENRIFFQFLKSNYSDLCSSVHNF